MKTIKIENLSLLEKLQFHKLMWLWLAENPDKDKVDWWEIWGNVIRDQDCFLCEIHKNDCFKCIFIKRFGDLCSFNSKSPYWKWFNMCGVVSSISRARYARQIAHCVDKEITYCLLMERIGYSPTVKDLERVK